MRKRSKFLLVAVFGLLPFWISLAIMVAAGSKHGHSGEYAAVAGWYPVLGARFSVYTLFVAILTVGVHEGVRGDAARKRRVATITLCVGIVVSLLLMAWPYYRMAENEKYNERQRAQVRDFVRRSDIVRNMMQGPFDVSDDGGLLGQDGRQWNFGVRIRPSTGSSPDLRAIYAIVDVKNRGSPPTFSIRCFTRQSDRERAASDPCRVPLARDEQGSLSPQVSPSAVGREPTVVPE